jgi:hypothetical protein
VETIGFEMFTFVKHSDLTMISPQFEKSLTHGIHADLKSLAGSWTGTTKVWFEPGKLADASPFSAEARSVLGHRFLHFEYQGSLQGNRIDGIMILGCSLGMQQMQCAWIDSFHNGTAIIFSENNGTSFPFSVKGSYGSEPKWGWRTNLEINTPKKFTITMFNISPEGEEAKAVEMVFERGSL